MPRARLLETEMGTKKLTKVLVASRRAASSQRLRSGLQGLKTIHILGEIHNWKDATQKIRELSPDIVLIDDGSDSGEISRNLRKISRETRVLVVSSMARHETVVEWLRAGVHGCLLGSLDPYELGQAIESIMDGGAFLSPEAAKILLQEYLQTNAKLSHTATPNLSEREKQVLALIVNGKTNKEAAAQLGLGVRTIETHRERLMRKLKARNSAQLTKYAVENGMVD